MPNPYFISSHINEREFSEEMREWRGNLLLGQAAPMAVAVWNVWGLNSAEKNLEVSKHLWSTKAEFSGLLETKVKSKKVAQLREAFGEAWVTFLNKDHLSLDGSNSIWVGFNKDCCMGTILRTHSQLMHAKLCDHGCLEVW